jgi:hypothetical protein
MVFATFCALNLPAKASTRSSSTLIIPALGSLPIVAYAHSVFATSCALNVPANASARPSSSRTRDGFQGQWWVLARMWSVFTTSCALNA